MSMTIMNNERKQPNSFKKAQLLASKLQQEAHVEESLIIEDYEGECERCALDYQPKICSMC